jgi:hypothetical protein
VIHAASADARARRTARVSPSTVASTYGDSGVTLGARLVDGDGRPTPRGDAPGHAGSVDQLSDQQVLWVREARGTAYVPGVTIPA